VKHTRDRRSIVHCHDDWGIAKLLKRTCKLLRLNPVSFCLLKAGLTVNTSSYAPPQPSPLLPTTTTTARYTDDVVDIKTNVASEKRKGAIDELTQKGATGASILRMAHINTDALKFVSETAKLTTKSGKLIAKRDCTFDFEIVKTKRLLSEFAVSMEDRVSSLQVTRHNSRKGFEMEMIAFTEELTKWHHDFISSADKVYEEHVNSVAAGNTARQACTETAVRAHETTLRIKDLRREYVCLSNAFAMQDAHWMQTMVGFNAPMRLADALTAVWESQPLEVSCYVLRFMSLWLYCVVSLRAFTCCCL
jgi:hypothetical protein